jgi:hypothetical protein
MINRAQPRRRKRAYHVGNHIVDIEDPPVGDKSLEKLGADSETEGADYECEVEGASAGGVEDPVEDDGEDEEGEEM